MTGKGITQNLLQEEILRQNDMRELFSFYDALLTARAQILQSLPSVVPAVGTDEFAKALSEGRYAASVAGPRIDSDAFAAAFQKIAAVVAKKALHLAKAVELYKKQLDLSALPGSGAIAKNPEDPEGRLFQQLYTNALQPFFEKFARELAPIVEGAEWHEAYCPVCGNRPAMARSVEGSGRDLYCTFCGARRHYPRLACPHCENKDHEQLGYLEISGEPQHRIDVCEDCKGYVKVVVQNGDLEGKGEGEDFNPFVADVLTLHLDALAQKQGYSPKPEHSTH